MNRHTLGAITIGVVTLFVAALFLTLFTRGNAARAAARQQAALQRAAPSAAAAANSVTVPKGTHQRMETATFGAGCFWGVEATFRQTPGVIDTAVGYSGGHSANPTYEEVCSDRTGHAEVVQVHFDPAKVSYEDLLRVFWENHDPTTLNRQGPDVGSQYRSAVFFHNDAHRQAAETVKAELDKSGAFRRPIVTTVEPARPFYRAEEYHQRYLEKRGLASCHL